MDATTIPIFAGAIVLVIGAIVTGTVTIIRAFRETKKAVQVQTGKIDHVKELVNSRYSKMEEKYTKVLEELASVRAEIARMSGLKTDEIKAAAAAQKSAINPVK